MGNNNSSYAPTCDVPDNRDPLKDIVVDILTDPTTYIPLGGLMGAAAKFGKKIGKLGKFKGTDSLKRENRMPRDAASSAGLNREQRRQLHDEMANETKKSDVALTYEDILAIAQRIKSGK